MDDPHTPNNQPTGKVPDYYNPHNTILDPNETASLLMHEPEQPDPREELRKKYPIKTIVGALVLIVTVLAIPVGVYLNQRPTKVFIEATSTPSPTPTATPTESAVPNL